MLSSTLPPKGSTPASLERAAQLQGEIAADFPGSRHVFVTGAGHYIQRDKPNVVINAARELKKAEVEDAAYRSRIEAMDKLELLEEMVRFQEERSRIGYLTPSMMLRGKVLFAALEENAETRELQILTRSYRRHLEFELADFLRKGMPNR